MKKVVLKLDFQNDKVKQKAMKTVSRLSGVESMALDSKDKKMTVTGDIDPVTIVAKLRKLCFTDILTIGPVKELEKKKGEPKKGEAKKPDEKKKYNAVRIPGAYPYYQNLVPIRPFVWIDQPVKPKVESHGTVSSPEDEESLPREINEVLPLLYFYLKTISHHFSILQVLDLSYTELNSLPQSISLLVALQKLFLRSCELLMELPPEIGELTNLEVLDLEGTEILCLPKEIAKLVNLMCLKVSLYGYANQTVIPRRVLSNLSRLNELVIDVTPYGEWWDAEVEAMIDDLCSLKELRTLKFYLPTAKLLEDLTLIFPGLANFRFIVGRHEEHFISRLPHDAEDEFNNREKLEKGLKYVNGNRIPNEISKVLKHADAFFLQRHWTAKSLSEFGHENMNRMKFCLVVECNEFRTIIDSVQFYQNNGRSESEEFQDLDEAIVLGSLEILIIRYMKNMESICKGPLVIGSLSNLQSLALHTCPNLTNLFTVDMLINLTNLKELIVEDCPKIESLVSLKSSCSKSGLFLPSLKKISLLELPELVSISGGLHVAPNLERMVIFYCPKLEKLSAMDVSSTDLKVIKGEKEWWDTLMWYESDLSTEHEDYLASLFVPLRRDGDLMAQLYAEDNDISIDSLLVAEDILGNGDDARKEDNPECKHLVQTNKLREPPYEGFWSEKKDPLGISLAESMRWII